jgi:2-methylcitrate dehydratase PrpD
MTGAVTMLGDFVAGSRWQDIPESLRHEAKRSLLNFFGCALGVADDPAVATAVKVMAPFSGPDRVTVIGRPERLDAMGASFANTIAANLLDYDDTHLRTVIHPTAPVAPPVLALAELHGLSGAAVLHAFILGAEVECRIGLAVSPAHYARGWHITSTCGVFGAAAACSRLLGLSAAQTAAALGIASSQSAGTVENLASSAKNVSMGNAARNGLLAALLAREGYSGAPTALEGKLGWARAMGDTPDRDAMTGALGDRWEFATNTYKLYPSGIVFHAVIDACLALCEQLSLTGSDVAAVTVRGDQLLLDRGDRPTLTERDARVSIAHNAAVALVRGSAGVADFAAAAVADPAVAAVRARVTAELDAGLPPAAAWVEVRTIDGRSASQRVDVARGGQTRPLSDADLELKFRNNAPGAQAVTRIEAIWAIEAAPNLRPLMALMAQGVSQQPQ